AAVQAPNYSKLVIVDISISRYHRDRRQQERGLRSQRDLRLAGEFIKEPHCFSRFEMILFTATLGCLR
ncbi:MAG: hypothetical protein ACYCVE_13195, partial [Gemmatimonadaceae bacterium]